MKLFGKKKDEFSDPMFPSSDPLGPPDALGLPSDGFGVSGTIDHTEPRNTFAPMNVIPPPASQSPSFAQSSSSMPQQGLERELQLINSKLDTLKAQLDALSLRIGQQEPKRNEDRPRRSW